MDKRRKWVKLMRKGKGEKVKRAKDEEANGQGEKKGSNGVPRPHTGQFIGTKTKLKL